MMNSGLCPHRARLRVKSYSLTHLSAFFSLMLAVLFVIAATPVSAQQEESPDELYIRIMAMIDRADALEKAGKTEAAQKKYADAEKALLYFKAVNPLFYPKTVAYRLKEVTDKAEARPPVVEPTNSPAPRLESPAPAASPKSGSVKLIDPGAEPRSALRLHPKAGDKQAMTITVKMSMDMTMPGAAQGQAGPGAIQMPAMTIPMDMTVQNVAANGDISYRGVIGDATAAADAGTQPQMAQAMNAAMGSIKGMTATGLMSDRGLSKKADVTAPATADPQVSQAVEQVKDGMSSFGARLPEEAVGPGAKWEIKRPVKSQGINLEQTETYELVSVDGDHLKMKFTVTQEAANQKIQNPAMKGAQMILTKMTTTGTGSSEADLSKLMPVTATVDMQTEMNSEISAGGKKTPMDMKMGINMSMESH